MLRVVLVLWSICSFSFLPAQASLLNLSIPIEPMSISTLADSTATKPIDNAINKNIDKKVIYGEDSQQEYFEIEDSFLKNLADSSVALIPTKRIERINTGWSQLHGKFYGEDNNLCQGERFYQQKWSAQCSGVLLGPNTILTAGHCVQTQKECRNLSFVFNFRFDNPDADSHVLPNAQIYFCKKLIISRDSEKEGLDFAIIELNRPVKDRSPTMFKKTSRLSKEDELFVVGYPLGLPLKAAQGEVRHFDAKYINSNLDVASGNSGSPVFNRRTGELEGILIAGEDDFDFHKDKMCNTIRRCPDDGCEGEDVLRMQEILKHALFP